VFPDIFRKALRKRGLPSFIPGQATHADVVPHYLHGNGVEIGAFKTPIPGIAPVYVDRFGHYANEPTGAEYLGDACALPFHTRSLDYVATSHVIEHVANPVAAFKEWCRVLKHDGIIYMVVPDRRLTFDHPRPLTAVPHILDDFAHGTTQVDGTHIDDFTFGVDWALFSPATPPDNAQAEREALAASYRERIAQGLEINIHFHTYEPEQMFALIAGANEVLGGPKIEVLHAVERFPAENPIGFLVLARVRHPLIARRAHKGTALRSDAQRF
jgi:SAM-dependent methyltransferase